MSRHLFQRHEHTQNKNSNAANQKIVCSLAISFVYENADKQKQNRETQKRSCSITASSQSIFGWCMVSALAVVCGNKINMCTK